MRVTHPHEDLAGHDLASQVTHDRPGERAYRRALVFFLASLVASAVPAFLSDGVDLLDPPWHVTAPVTLAYVAFAVVRARAAARGLESRAPRHHALQVALLHVTAILFAGLGGATLTWETARLLDHRLDQGPPRSVVAHRTAIYEGGRGTTAEYRIHEPEVPGTFTVVGDAPPAALVVQVHPGALGYRWVHAE